MVSGTLWALSFLSLTQAGHSIALFLAPGPAISQRRTPCAREAGSHDAAPYELPGHQFVELSWRFSQDQRVSERKKDLNGPGVGVRAKSPASGSRSDVLSSLKDDSESSEGQQLAL